MFSNVGAIAASHRDESMAQPREHAALAEPPSRRLRVWIGKVAGAWAVLALPLGGCAGPQSALAPGGRGAEHIAWLFWRASAEEAEGLPFFRSSLRRAKPIKSLRCKRMRAVSVTAA